MVTDVLPSDCTTVGFIDDTPYILAKAWVWAK